MFAAHREDGHDLVAALVPPVRAQPLTVRRGRAEHAAAWGLCESCTAIAVLADANHVGGAAVVDAKGNVAARDESWIVAFGAGYRPRRDTAVDRRQPQMVAAVPIGDGGNDAIVGRQVVLGDQQP